MTLAMSRELKLRILSALVMVTVAVAATYVGGLVFRALAAAIGLLVYYEWSKITGLVRNSLRAAAFGWLAMGLIVATMVAGATELTVPLFAGVVVTVMIPALLGKVSWWHPGGLFYAGLSAISLAAIRGEDQLGLVAMLFVFVIVWATDILAYFVGRAIGGPKLAPRISPGKTWSGAIGGTLAGVVAGLTIAFVHFEDVGIWVGVIALTLSVFSQIGDLFESFIKRRFGVKDSSRLIPGHGGVMDRVDGLVFACFSAFFLAVLFSAADRDSVTSMGIFLFGL